MDETPTLADEKQAVLQMLTSSLQQARSGYNVFTSRPVPDDAKEFTQYQTACKTALAHIEVLLRLTRIVQQAAIADSLPQHAGHHDEIAAALSELHTYSRDDDA